MSTEHPGTRPCEEKALALFAKTFGGKPGAVARAPGRVELIGNHLDYNGGRVAGATIDRFIVVAARARDDNQIVLASDAFPEKVTADAAKIRRLDNKRAWANYPLGVLQALSDRHGIAPRGLESVFVSSIPTGAGLSSSAALELASALAFASLAGVSLGPEDLVAIGRAAENDFVGVPTGLLDQTTCAYGQMDHAVFIDSRSGGVALSPLPDTVRLWVFLTGVRHELADSAYSKRHDECREALRFFQQRLPEIQWLADLPLEELEKAKESLPPNVYRRTRHVVTEDARVRQMEAALQAGDIAAAGQPLFASHASSRDYFENSCPELDFLVGALEGRRHVYGARLTGGGFGGAVLALTSPAFSREHADAIGEEYARQFNTAAPPAFAQKTAPAALLIEG